MPAASATPTTTVPPTAAVTTTPSANPDVTDIATTSAILQAAKIIVRDD